MPPELGRAARRVAGKAARTVGLRGGGTAPAARGNLTSRGRKVLLETVLFDQAWVELQLGRTFGSKDAAADAYLATPGCSPHPLFLGEYLDPKFGRPPKGRNPLLWYLNHAWVRRKATPPPLVALDAMVAAQPELDEAKLGPLVGWLETATPESVLPAAPGAPTVTLGEVYAASTAAVKRWRKEMGWRQAPRVTDKRPDNLLTATGPALTGSDGQPLVSIVMPLWNRATVVRAAIESVQAQSHQDWELIVVDDGSTDDSLAVLTGMAAYDERIVVVEGQHRGVSAARNAALARARGRYVAFLDTDNQWRPDYLHVMLTELEAHPDWGMAHAALRASKDGEEYYRAFEGTHRHLLVANHVDLNVLVVRRELVDTVGGFDESLRRGVDYDLLLKLTRTSDLHLVRYIGVDYVDDEADDAGPRISTQESPAWLSVIASRHLVDWPAAVAAERVPGRTSVVLPAQGLVRPTARWIRSVADALAAGSDLELVVVGVRLPRWQHVALSVLTTASPGSRLVTIQADRGLATTANVGFASTTGERVLLVLGQVEPDAATAADLAASLADPDQAVGQPVVLGPSGSVLSAGAVFDPDTVLPQAFLRDHAVDDAEGCERLALPAAAGPVVAVRGDHLARLGGLDPLCDHLAVTDLSLRLHREGLGGTVLHPDARFVSKGDPAPADADVVAALRVLEQRHDGVPPGSAEAWAAAGFAVDHHRYDVLPGQPVGPDDHPVLGPRAVLRPLRASVEESAPALRWAIDLASPVGEPGRAWGDTHYGEALAGALCRRGQHVAVDARDTRHRSSRDYDDVILVLRGLDRVTPRPGCVNLEWIISHPDLVTAEELSGFDAVFAASHSWSERATAEWGVEVRPLLQATDASLFHPGRAEFDTGADVLFIGNSRGVFRSSLRHATAAGIDVTVHGSGWSSMLPAGAVASRLVDNRDLGALYAAAGVVLNDHWEDMRLTGFVSNRLMDAAATGARVASDEIPGLDLTALFGGLVQTWRDEHDLARIVRERETLFPSGEERVRAAEKVAAEHSFDARAEILLDHAVRAVRERWPADPHR
ncbi:MAG: glycosyltransferase [Actinomycetota bacterium]|nr:glycosyltransferase [Actinomycetota bacterium]